MSAKRDISLIAGDTYIQQIIFDESQAGFSFSADINGVPFDCSVSSDNLTVTITYNSIKSAALDLDNTVYKWKLRRSDNAATPNIFTVLYGKVFVSSV